MAVWYLWRRSWIQVGQFNAVSVVHGCMGTSRKLRVRKERGERNVMSGHVVSVLLR